MEKVTEFLNPDKINSLVGFGMSVVLALVILIVGLWIAKRVRKLISKLAAKIPHLDEALLKFLD